MAKKTTKDEEIKNTNPHGEQTVLNDAGNNQQEQPAGEVAPSSEEDKEQKQVAKKPQVTAPNGQKERARTIAENYKVKSVFVNSKGEFFTQEVYALASEGGKKDKVKTFNF
jgi:hypothetical protein